MLGLLQLVIIVPKPTWYGNLGQVFPFIFGVGFIVFGIAKKVRAK